MAKTVLAMSVSAFTQDSEEPREKELVQQVSLLGRMPNIAVGVFSRQPKPQWFDKAFEGSTVHYVQDSNRLSGGVLKHVIEQHSIAGHNVLMLAVKAEDVAMGKNCGAVLVAADWSTDRRVQQLGISVASGSELFEVVKLTADWNGGWWFSGQMPHYSVRALADLSQFYKSQDQQRFAERLKVVVKQGSLRLTPLLTTTLKSMLIDGLAKEKDLMWGVYPSSRSSNPDSEVLSDFTHRLRTAGSRVHFAKRNAPLFIRHKETKPRHKQASGDGRLSPDTQIETVYVNPEYRGKVRGRRVIVIDDCTTYGVSFAVAAALLRRAGAAAVDGVAIGKFGNQLSYLDIEINSDPFAPISTGAYRVAKSISFDGKTDSGSQDLLRKLLV